MRKEGSMEDEEGGKEDEEGRKVRKMRKEGR
jgi:hypothetical protein